MAECATQEESDTETEQTKQAAETRIIYSLIIPQGLFDALELEAPFDKQWSNVRAQTSEWDLLAAKIPLPPSLCPDDDAVFFDSSSDSHDLSSPRGSSRPSSTSIDEPSKLLIPSNNLATHERQTSTILPDRDGSEHLSESMNSPTTPTDNVPDVIRRVPRPAIPIRVNTADPPLPFSLEAQRSIMKWTHARRHFWPDPEWLEEPRIHHIKEMAWPYLQDLGVEYDSIEVEFLAEGGFNRAFTIHTAIFGKERDFIFRVALPINPYYKIESDVATTEIVRYFTSIPVPIIYAYDSSTNNSIGLEWMLMEKVQGRQLSETWTALDFDTKRQIASTVAGWTNQLSSITSNKIGSIYMRYTEEHLDFYVDRPVAYLLTVENRLTYDCYRGPYRSLEEYYDAILTVAAQDVEALTEAFHSGAFQFERPIEHPLECTFYDYAYLFSKNHQSEWTEEQWHAEQSRELETLSEGIKMFQWALPKICTFLPETSRPLTTYLAHDDISRRNIFVDESGTPTALLDWENIFLRPLTLLTQAPVLLQSVEYEFDEPIYDRAEQEAQLRRWGELSLTDEEIEQIHVNNEESIASKLQEFQCTKLRPEYREELKRIGCPLGRYDWDDFFWVYKQLHERITNISGDADEHVEWLESVYDMNEIIEGREEYDVGDAEERERQKRQFNKWKTYEPEFPEDTEAGEVILRNLGYNEKVIRLYKLRLWRIKASDQR